MDLLLSAITSRRPPWATIALQLGGYRCASGRHAWAKIVDASRCCNGWFLRIALPGERVALVTARSVKTGDNVGREVQHLAWQKLEELPADDPARQAMETTVAVA